MTQPLRTRRLPAQEPLPELTARNLPPHAGNPSSAPFVGRIVWSRLGPWLPLMVLAAAGIYQAVSARVGWYGPLTDAHAFRQTQTALSAQRLVGRLSSFWSYETPVLGPPWSIPFEFPLYQMCVAAVVTVLKTPLDQTARFVSLAFFWMTLFPLSRLLVRLQVPRELRLVVLAVVALNPFYLFWSRCVLIESTALFCSMAFLAAGGGYLFAPRPWKLAACLAWGVLAGLTKITTFVPYGLATLLWRCIGSPSRGPRFGWGCAGRRPWQPCWPSRWRPRWLGRHTPMPSKRRIRWGKS